MASYLLFGCATRNPVAKPGGFPHLHGVEHRITKPNHPRTNGQVERMNRTIKEATVKRFFYDTHDQLKVHLSDLIAPTTLTLPLQNVSLSELL